MERATDTGVWVMGSLALVVVVAVAYRVTFALTMLVAHAIDTAGRFITVPWRCGAAPDRQKGRASLRAAVRARRRDRVLRRPVHAARAGTTGADRNNLAIPLLRRAADRARGMARSAVRAPGGVGLFRRNDALCVLFRSERLRAYGGTGGL